MRLLLPLLMVLPLGLSSAEQVKPPKLAAGSEIFRKYPPARIVSLQGDLLPAGNPIDGATGHLKNSAAPALLLFPSKAAAPKGTILLFPGGGYAILEMIREGYNTARFLNKCGYDVALLEYLAPKSSEATRDNALRAALRGCRLIRSESPSLALHTGRFGIMGYSAGGHLAARTVQHLSSSQQPDDLILIYPAYLDECHDGGTSPAVTPPARPRHLVGIFGANDRKSWISGFRDYEKAWLTNGGNASSYLLPKTGHGFGLVEADEGKRTAWQSILAKNL